MRTFAQKQHRTQPTSSSPAWSSTAAAAPGLPHCADPGLHVQRRIGYQAVQRLLWHTEGARSGHGFSRMLVRPGPTHRVQAKLKVSSPADIYEQEADRVSEQVMRMPEPRSQGACAYGGECPKRQAEPGKQHKRLQTKRVGSSDLGESAVPPIVHEVLRSPGRPLDLATRAFMDPRFGYDFSGVRVHADARADTASAAVSARAFTVGADVVFRQGELAPHTEAGRALLAHELAHVVQQQGAASPPPVGIAESESSSMAEPQAEEATRAMDALPLLGKPRLDRGMSGLVLRRQAQVPVSCDDLEPDSGAVAEIIDKVYGGSRSNTYPVDALRDAWFHVRNQREQPGGANCCSPELAAAEHYLYARYAVANRDYSPFEMKAMIWGYGYFKFLVPRQGICPKSPDTQGSRDWAYRGADDGATDLFHQELAQNDTGQAEGDQVEVAG